MRRAIVITLLIVLVVGSMGIGYTKGYASEIYELMYLIRDKIPFANDSVFGQEDEWLYPWETIERGYGDCEDTAILAAAILEDAGYRGVRVEIGWDTHWNGHVWFSVQGINYDVQVGNRVPEFPQRYWQNRMSLTVAEAYVMVEERRR